MLKISALLLLVLLVHHPIFAQLGTSNIGVTKPIGKGSIADVALGKATTPACLFPGGYCAGGCPVYVFTGSGNWDVPGNWKDFLIPPDKLPSCYEIIIYPTDSSECLLNIPLQILGNGSKITVAAGKRFRVPLKVGIKE